MKYAVEMVGSAIQNLKRGIHRQTDSKEIAYAYF
jgi:hypothetical protein